MIVSKNSSKITFLVFFKCHFSDDRKKMKLKNKYLFIKIIVNQELKSVFGTLKEHCGGPQTPSA